MSIDDPRPPHSAEEVPAFRASDLVIDETSSTPTIDPLSAQVLALLEAPPEQKTAMQTLGLLVISLVAFSAAGLMNYGLPELLLLVGVLLFHEFGHYLGMRLFDYQDVRMFFVPFFGAAVSGRSTSVAGYKEAIVILLGPLPGIVLGIGLGAACMDHDDKLLRSAAQMLLFINGFNLLPFLPLDGGRLLQLVLFSRQRHLEAVFRIVTAAGLILYGWNFDASIIGFLGVFMLISTGHTFRVSTLAQQLRGPAEPTGEMNFSPQIPPEQALPIVIAVRETFPKVKPPKALANTARQVWERMHVRPPGMSASIGLLSLYVVGFLAAPAAMVTFERPVRTLAPHVQLNGAISNVEELRVWGQLRAQTELNADHEYHGRHVEFSPQDGRKSVEGSFSDGLHDGTWKFYGPNEQLVGTAVFQRGQVVETRGKIPGMVPGK